MQKKYSKNLNINQKNNGKYNTSEIKLSVELDENRVPEKLMWTALEGGIQEEEVKSIYAFGLGW